MVADIRLRTRPSWDSLPAVWAVVVLGALFIYLCVGRVLPNDFWWHMRAGQVMLERGSILRTDIFTYTRFGQPWIYQPWLMEIALYLLYALGDLPLLLLVRALLVTGSYGLLLHASRLLASGNLRYAALSVLFAVALGFTNTNLRPQLISFPLFSWTLCCVIKEDSSPVRNRILWSLPPLFVLWANSHGGFIFGLLLLLATLAGLLCGWLSHRAPFPRRLLIVSLLCTGSVLINPWHVGILSYVLGFAAHLYTNQYNDEFLPPTVRDPIGAIFFALGGLLLLWLMLSRYRPNLPELLRLLVFAALSLYAVRGIVWFGFVAAPVVAASLAQRALGCAPAGAADQGIRSVNRVLLGLMGVFCVLALPWLRPFYARFGASPDYQAADTPVAAAQALCELARERGVRLLNTPADGSYLVWACPDVPVFIDTRIELYPFEQWQDYMAVRDARYDWRAILERYQVDTLLLSRDQHAQLILAVSADTDWRQVYADDRYIVYENVPGTVRAPSDVLAALTSEQVRR